MDLYARQQFEFLFATAVERFAERLEQRNAGATRALARLRADRDGEGVWLAEFVGAVFSEFLLDDAAGAAFILQALSARPAPAAANPANATIDTTLRTLARAAFADLLAAKVEEDLERRSAFAADESDQPDLERRSTFEADESDQPDLERRSTFAADENRSEDLP